jgi:hypothetical protein
LCEEHGWFGLFVEQNWVLWGGCSEIKIYGALLRCFSFVFIFFLRGGGPYLQFL